MLKFDWIVDSYQPNWLQSSCCDRNESKQTGRTSWPLVHIITHTAADIISIIIYMYSPLKLAGVLLRWNEVFMWRNRRRSAVWSDTIVLQIRRCFQTLCFSPSVSRRPLHHRKWKWLERKRCLCLSCTAVPLSR